MSDPFDPFEPLEAAAEGTTGGETARGGFAAEEQAVERATGATKESAMDSSEPARELRAPRRWASPTARSASAARSASTARSAPPLPDRLLPAGADLAGGSSASGSAPLPEADLAAFRTIALPNLEAAVERLEARGHLASLADELAEREPALVIRFRPNQGPLAPLGARAREPARFELRLAAETDGKTGVLAGYTLGANDAPFTRLSRAPLPAVRGEWVAQRFVDFVRRCLALG